MRRIMNLPNQVLWSLVVMLAVAALALTTVVAARQRYAGWSWWLGAVWAVTLGLALVALGSPSRMVNAAAEWLLLQWPVAFLIGVRRFHARFQWPSELRFDGWVLACAALVAAIAALAWPVDSGPDALAGAGATLAVHLYVACLLFCAPSGSERPRRRGSALHGRGNAGLCFFPGGLGAARLGRCSALGVAGLCGRGRLLGHVICCDHADE